MSTSYWNLLKTSVGEDMLDAKQLRYFFIENFIITYIFSTVTALIVLFTTKNNKAEHNAAVAGLILLWTAFPFGLWGAMKVNRGMLAVYVLYGVVVVVGKVVMTVAATVMVAASCQVGQSSFQGCGEAELPCLANSTCSRDMINAYNDVANVTCEAWSTNDCNHAPSARTSMGFTTSNIFLVCLDVFFSLAPVFFGFMYYTRLEVADPVPLHKDDEEMQEQTKNVTQPTYPHGLKHPNAPRNAEGGCGRI